MAYEIEGTAARGLHLQRAVPVLGRRGPRLQDLRHDDRLGHREGHDRGRRRRRPDDRRLGPHPREHPRSRSPGRPSCSSTIARRDEQQGALLQPVHRAARRRRSRIWPGSSARSSRSSASPIAFTRRGRQGPADRSASSSTPRWRRTSARPATRRRSPRRCSARSPDRRSMPPRRARTRRDGSAHGIPSVQTSRATTPSRATSASPPDGGPVARHADVHRRATSASRGATGRSWPVTRSPCRPLGVARALAAGGVGVRPLPPPRRAAGAAGSASRRRCSSPAGSLMIVAMMLPTSDPADRRPSARSSRGGGSRRLLVGLARARAISSSGRRSVSAPGSPIAASTPPSTRRRGWREHPQLISRPRPSRSPGCASSARSEYRCLDECRSPLGFVMNHWRGVARAARGVRGWASPTGCSASAAAGR